MLIIVEIYLQPYFDYKGGSTVTAASKSPNEAKTAYVFMIQSLLLPQKNVLHMLPVAQINTRKLHTIWCSIITEPENVAFCNRSYKDYQ